MTEARNAVRRPELPDACPYDKPVDVLQGTIRGIVKDVQLLPRADHERREPEETHEEHLGHVEGDRANGNAHAVEEAEPIKEQKGQKGRLEQRVNKQRNPTVRHDRDREDRIWRK